MWVVGAEFELGSETGVNWRVWITSKNADDLGHVEGMGAFIEDIIMLAILDAAEPPTLEPNSEREF